MDSELMHLEYHIHRAVAAALRGEPETDLWVTGALAIIDQLKKEAGE